jgi:hypothetical protein
MIMGAAPSWTVAHPIIRQLKVILVETTARFVSQILGSDSDACFHLYSIDIKLIIKQLNDLSL